MNQEELEMIEDDWKAELKMDDDLENMWEASQESEVNEMNEFSKVEEEYFETLNQLGHLYQKAKVLERSMKALSLLDRRVISYNLELSRELARYIN